MSKISKYVYFLSLLLYTVSSASDIHTTQNEFFRKLGRPFFKAINRIKVNEKDSNFQNIVVETYNIEGKKLLTKTGCQVPSGFTFKIDQNDLINRFSPLSQKSVFMYGAIYFRLYYNGIEIEEQGVTDGYRSNIEFSGNEIISIHCETPAVNGVPVESFEPVLSFPDALGKVYSTSDTNISVCKPTAHLCYLLKDNLLKLCWKVHLQAGVYSKKLWINTKSGQIEDSLSIIKVRILDDSCSGEFEDLPEKWKLKINTITNEFEPEELSINIGKINEHYMGLVLCFLEMYCQSREILMYNRPQNKHCESFIKTIKGIVIDFEDSVSIKKGIQAYEKAGLNLFEKAGYPNHPGFSLKLDPHSLSGNCLHEFMYFIEYFNGIKIDDSERRIVLCGDKVTSISCRMFAQDDMGITNQEPLLSPAEAFGKYLSSSKKDYSQIPPGELCYLLTENGTPELCWRFELDGVFKLQTLWVNAMSGKTERENYAHRCK
jgi:hypothetical protein